MARNLYSRRIRDVCKVLLAHDIRGALNSDADITFTAADATIALTGTTRSLITATISTTLESASFAVSGHASFNERPIVAGTIRSGSTIVAHGIRALSGVNALLSTTVEGASVSLAGTSSTPTRIAVLNAVVNFLNPIVGFATASNGFNGQLVFTPADAVMAIAGHVAAPGVRNADISFVAEGATVLIAATFISESNAVISIASGDAVASFVAAVDNVDYNAELEAVAGDAVMDISGHVQEPNTHDAAFNILAEDAVVALAGTFLAAPNAQFAIQLADATFSMTGTATGWRGASDIDGLIVEGRNMVNELLVAA